MNHQTDVRIALLTDSHAWPGCQQSFGTEGEQLQPWFETIHATLLQEVQAAAPDILIHLGDFTCGGGTFEMPSDLFRDTMERLAREYRLVAPHFYGLPGNHDCPAGSNDYSFAETILGLSPRLGETVDTGSARLIFVHSQGHSDEERRSFLPKDPTFGWVADAELERLDRSLAAAHDRPVIIFIHQLLQPWANPRPWRDLYAVANSQAVLDIFARHGNVRAVFQGHAHILDVQEMLVGGRPVHFVVTPSSIQFPLGWLLLDLTPASLRVRFRPLPLSALTEQSRTAGVGSDWRAGDPVWHDFSIGM